MKIPITPILEITSKTFQKSNIQLFIKREDLNHSAIQGNKLRKLKYNILQAKSEGKKTLLTFGGAFSNHIYATAAAGTAFGFKTIGVIRGEKIEPLNATLQYAKQQGMQLHFISREKYRDKENPEFIQSLKNKFGDFYYIPEGGTNDLAIQGCKELGKEIHQQVELDFCCIPVGTGGTITGVIQGLPKVQVLGFSSLKGNFLEKEIKNLLPKNGIQYQNWKVINQYHFGGYAKFNPKLIDFINHFKHVYKIQLEPIYTAKMMFGIFQLIEQDYFPKDSKIVAIHTGGLQGVKGFNQRFGNLLT